MKILRTLGRIGLASLLLCAAVIQIARPGIAPRESVTPKKQSVIVKIVVITLIAIAVLITAGGLSFIFSGVYPIAADKPHFAPVRWLLQTVRTRSVQFHSQEVRAPNLRDESLLKNGFVLYRKNCQPCHGAPGIGADQIGLGINPKPPLLVTAGTHWSDSEIFWIISHGLKMSGMPAFAPRLSDTDRWGIVAFLRRLTRLSPAEYEHLISAADQGLDLSGWGTDDDPGFRALKSGNAERGRQLLRTYGCITCHEIPGNPTAHVGPPLTNFAERQYLAGLMVNLPTNTMNWIMNPKRYKPATVMPVLDVKSGDAVDIAAYLYTLGSPKRIHTILQTSAHRP